VEEHLLENPVLENPVLGNPVLGNPVLENAESNINHVNKNTVEKNIENCIGKNKHQPQTLSTLVLAIPFSKRYKKIDIFSKYILI